MTLWTDCTYAAEKNEDSTMPPSYLQRRQLHKQRESVAFILRGHHHHHHHHHHHLFVLKHIAYDICVWHYTDRNNQSEKHLRQSKITNGHWRLLRSCVDIAEQQRFSYSQMFELIRAKEREQFSPASFFDHAIHVCHTCYVLYAPWFSVTLSAIAPAIC